MKFITPLSVEEARNSRDTFAKQIYLKNFEWIVKKLNDMILVDDSPYSLYIIDWYYTIHQSKKMNKIKSNNKDKQVTIPITTTRTITIINKKKP